MCTRSRATTCIMNWSGDCVKDDDIEPESEKYTFAYRISDPGTAGRVTGEEARKAIEDMKRRHIEAGCAWIDDKEFKSDEQSTKE